MILSEQIPPQEIEKARRIVPQNLDKILEFCDERQISYDLSEIWEEVKAGNVKKTRKIKNILEGDEKSRKELEFSKYGRIIPHEEARELISAFPVPVFPELLTDGFYSFAQQDRIKGIEFRDTGVVKGIPVTIGRCLLISKYAPRPEIEMTLRAESVGSPLVPIASVELGIGFNYQGRDYDFNPHQRLVINPLKKRTIGDEFSLFNRTYEIGVNASFDETNSLDLNGNFESPAAEAAFQVKNYMVGRMLNGTRQ